ncbi:phosphoglycolate phosphatase protein [Halorhabdus tiamatea SARL4B]|uniref:HAD-superfamily hydrolase, subfamily IA variant 1 n=1 Tax=Halorhabdus tiamatea SARL4B TaxID=1033806 RepID=F7PJH1_9EURY|nr:HAD-IA family hydrolase [Halorhabdus tiamatea]ERJ05792.1 phosphoglycolate phosphatase protein [Halorhabdus tiamatea SARL4B]CCQ34273.1 HAD-superfamily hydrolase, subfamily IA variant 1 [Halorhabdus tiamatea SARL4B]
MYEAIVFDNDGVLMELTEMDLHRRAARDAFEAVGVADPADEHVEAMSIGVTVPKLHAVCDHYGLDPPEFWRTRDDLMARRQQAAIRRGEKGVYDDVTALDALDRPAGIVSSNQQATVDFGLDAFDLARHFETVYGREPTVESLRRKKPAPYYIQQALSDLGTADALYVGDSETDVEAAHAAGIDAAFVRRPHRAGENLSVTPEYEIDGLADVPQILDGEPPASD